MPISRIDTRLMCLLVFLHLISLPAVAQVIGQKQAVQTEPAAPIAKVVPALEESAAPGDGPATTAAIVDIEFQIFSKQNQIGDLQKLDSLISSFLKNKDSIKRAVENAKDVDCVQDFAKLHEDYENVSRAIGSFWLATQELQKAEGQPFSPILGNFFAASTTDRCRLLKEEADRKSVDAAGLQFEEILKTHKTRLLELQNDLLKLQGQLQKALNSHGALKIAENLPELILIIAGASIAIILVVRLFGADLQMEWVASGQVIQFTTVMILLSALMVLGLTGILRENTLGTLLGGLAGYVLAQGVGRATARATLNAANAANASPPAAARVVPPAV